MRVLFSTTGGTEALQPADPGRESLRGCGSQGGGCCPVGFAEAVAGAGFDHVPFGAPSPKLMGKIFGGFSQLTFEEANRVVLAEVFGRLDAQAALQR